MKIFETERLIVKELELDDYSNWRELLSDPRIITTIPQRVFSEDEIQKRFEQNRNAKKIVLENERVIWGVFVKGNSTMMGLCMLLTNNDGDREIGYRFKFDYWGKGYATEMTQGFIGFCFTVLGIDKITGDASIENISSLRVLAKFMHPVREFFNERDNCTDRRFELYRKEDSKA